MNTCVRSVRAIAYSAARSSGFCGKSTASRSLVASVLVWLSVYEMLERARAAGVVAEVDQQAVVRALAVVWRRLMPA